MGKPAAIIIGGHKCGTTSLFYWLIEHPELCGPFGKEAFWIESITGDVLPGLPAGAFKETAYFSFKTQLGMTIDPYWALFPDTGGIEASPDYLTTKDCAKKLARELPDVKLIVILRDPVERCWSHYWHEVMYNKIEELPFVQAIHRRIENPRDEYHFNYLESGCYSRHLFEWAKYFPLENICLIKSEEMFESPEQVLLAVQCFIGVEPIKLDHYGIHLKNENKPEMPDYISQYLSEYYKNWNDELCHATGINFEWQ